MTPTTSAQLRAGTTPPDPAVSGGGHRWPEPHCECDRTDHPQFSDGKCHRTGDGAEAMTGGKVVASPALCLPCLFACSE